MNIVTNFRNQLSDHSSTILISSGFNGFALILEMVFYVVTKIFRTGGQYCQMSECHDVIENQDVLVKLMIGTACLAAVTLFFGILGKYVKRENEEPDLENTYSSDAR